MYATLDKDMVLFSTETDNSIYENSMAYYKANDDNSIRLKKNFFAVIAHGLVDRITVGVNTRHQYVNWDLDDFYLQILCAWAEKGGNRSILLLSCYTGYAMARPLARRLGLPIVAPRSAATVLASGEIESVQMSSASRNPVSQKIQVPNRTDWVFVSPTGQVEVFNCHLLDKVKAVNFARQFRTIL